MLSLPAIFLSYFENLRQIKIPSNILWSILFHSYTFQFSVHIYLSMNCKFNDIYLFRLKARLLFEKFSWIKVVWNADGLKRIKKLELWIFLKFYQNKILKELVPWSTEGDVIFIYFLHEIKCDIPEIDTYLFNKSKYLRVN